MSFPLPLPSSLFFLFPPLFLSFFGFCLCFVLVLVFLLVMPCLLILLIKVTCVYDNSAVLSEDAAIENFWLTKWQGEQLSCSGQQSCFNARVAEFGNLDCKGGETSPSRAESVLRSSTMSEDLTVSARSSFIHRSRIRPRLRTKLRLRLRPRMCSCSYI